MSRTLALCLATVLGLGTGTIVTPAAADPDRPGWRSTRPPVADPVPSGQQVEQARARVAATARDVSVIQAGLVLADRRLHAASVRAEQASEAYNGALWRLRQARDAARAARVEAARARRAVAGQRDRIGALAAQSYQQAGELSALSAVVGADGPQGVLDQYAALQGASTSVEADYQRFEATDSLARVFEARAEQAEVEQASRAAETRRARSVALTAAESAQAEASAIAAEKDTLVRELARAQHVSVSLARTRQAALERVAQQRAADRSRRLAEARARAQEPAEGEASAGQAAPTTDVERAVPGRRRAVDHTPSGRDTRSGGVGALRDGASEEVRQSARPAPEPAPAASPAPAPAASLGGAQQAIRFAEAQLGEPYRWGAAGPGSWDCSGLTMQAWSSAGRSLPHFSVAQYEAGVPVSVSELRRGDLVFWSSDGTPGGIHHVALYVGGGQIIHAPRTGRPVTMESMYYWVPPDLFVRV